MMLMCVFPMASFGPAVVVSAIIFSQVSALTPFLLGQRGGHGRVFSARWRQLVPHSSSLGVYDVQITAWPIFLSWTPKLLNNQMENFSNHYSQVKLLPPGDDFCQRHIYDSVPVCFYEAVMMPGDWGRECANGTLGVAPAKHLLERIYF